MNVEEIKKYCEEILPYAIEQRRYFHCNPEPTSMEFNTIKHICSELDKMGIEYAAIPDGGVLAKLESRNTIRDEKEPHVLIRADCDALTMEENSENGNQQRQFISQNKGVAHMCGHDGHMAILLSAAKILSEIVPDLESGTVYILFERGEEGGNCIYYVMKYIEKMNIRIDTCYALHVEPEIETGKMAITAGPTHAGNVNFEIELTGQGGHGSRPDLANSPLDCFISIANQLKDVRLKYISPMDLLTYNIGSVQCGQKRNIVPEKLEFKGTARFYNSAAGRTFKEKLDAIIQSNAMLYGCKATYNVFTGPSLAVVNDERAAALASEAVAELWGEDCLTENEIGLGSESFSTLTAFYPGVMSRLGVKNKEKGAFMPLHNPRFDLDEEGMKFGIGSHVAYVLKYLETKPDMPFSPSFANADEVLKYTNRPVPKRYDM